MGLVLTGLLLTASLQLMAATDVAPTPAQRQQWRANHPARVKDNARIRHQKMLLRHDLKSGKITKDQYDAQMKDLNTIKTEEKVDAKANENGGHLTASQQQAINSQLNESRKDIHQDVKSDAVNTAPATPGN